MAALTGTNLAAPIVPFTDADEYETHDEAYGRGGYRTVATIAARNAIPLKRRRVGMLVHVTDDNQTYQLIGGTDNDDWGVYGGNMPVSTPQQIALAERSDLLLSNLANRETARGNVALGMFLSVSDVDASLPNADWTDALHVLIQRCCDEEKALLIPTGVAKRFTRTVNVNGVCSIFGWGSDSVLKTTGLDAPMIQFTISGYKSNITWKGFRLVNELSGVGLNSSAIKVTGPEFDGVGTIPYFEQNLFQDIEFVGFYTGIDNDLKWHASIYGNENLLNNTTFRRICTYYSPGIINAKYGVRMRYGSGTGNLHEDPRGNIALTIEPHAGDLDPDPAHVRVEGGYGFVAQDIIVSGHITAYRAALMSIHGNMLINNARVNENTQIDAGAIDGLRFVPAPDILFNTLDNATYGGDTPSNRTWKPGYGLRSYGQAISDQKKGVVRGGLSAGTNAVMHIGRVEMATYTGSMLWVSCAGVTQGVDGGQHLALLQLVRADGNVMAKVLMASCTSEAEDFFHIHYEAFSDHIDFYAVYTSTLTNSTCDGQTVLLGGEALLRRGDSAITPSGPLTPVPRQAALWDDVYGFVPVVSAQSGGGFTYGTRSGTYTRNGRCVKGSGYVEITGVGDASGAVFLSVPHPFSASFSSYGAAAVVDAIQNFTGMPALPVDGDVRAITGRPSAPSQATVTLKKTNGTNLEVVNLDTGSGTVVLGYSFDFITDE